MTKSLCKQLTDFIRENEGTVQEKMQKVINQFNLSSNQVRYNETNNSIYVQHAGITNIINVGKREELDD